MTRPLLILAALMVGCFAAGIAVARIGDDDPLKQPVSAEIEAAVLVDAAAVEMHGYDPSGKPGKWIYDCTAVEDPKPGEPSLICEQREEAP